MTFDRTPTQAADRAASYDAGLRTHMQSIYNRMTAGVLVTALTSWLVASSPALMQFFLGGPQMYLVIFAPLAIVWFGFNPYTMPASKLRISFFALSVLYGISFASIFFMFQLGDIFRAFFITAGAFAGLSLYGYTTRKNLDALGSFAVMGIWGAFLLSIVSIFFHSPLMSNVISGVAVVAFAGLTAWQTQSMKEMYHPSAPAETLSRMGWAAALNLYISFIALFQHILHFVGNRN